MELRAGSRKVLAFFAGFQIAVFAFVAFRAGRHYRRRKLKIRKKCCRARLTQSPIRYHHVLRLALIVTASVTPWSSVVPDKLFRLLSCLYLVGLPAAASVINFAVLTRRRLPPTASSTSRMLFGSAQEGGRQKRSLSYRNARTGERPDLLPRTCLLGGVVMLMVNPSVIGAFTMITTVSRHPVYVCSDHHSVFIPVYRKRPHCMKNPSIRCRSAS